MKIGETIRIFRIANNCSVRWLSEKCGFSETLVSEVENNHKEPSLKTLKKFANSLNVPLSAIFEICELSEEANWDYQKTLLETLKIYISK